MPASMEVSVNSRKIALGIPVSTIARAIAFPTKAEVRGCAGCAFTTTGQPEAKAEAVSPPATEKANGKLLALNTAIGPNGWSMRRISGLGTGLRSGRAVSIRASTHDPSSIKSANIAN
jgi:hypothetical protein